MQNKSKSELTLESIDRICQGDVAFLYSLSNGVNILEEQSLEIGKVYLGSDTSTGEEVEFMFSDIEAIRRDGVEMHRSEDQAKHNFKFHNHAPDRINVHSSGVKVEGHKGKWYVSGSEIIKLKNYFLMEHETHGEDAPCVIIDPKGALVMEDVYNGFDDLKDELENQEYEAQLSSQESNFKVDRLESGNFVVRSDSERFGKQAITFESHSRDECVGYISRNLIPLTPHYYIIEDLSTWSNSGTGKQSVLERFDTLREAVEKFKEYRNADYDYSDGKAKLTMGVSIGSSEVDILQVRNNSNCLVQDFMHFPRINTNKTFLSDMEKLHSAIGFDMIRLYSNDKGEKLKIPADIPFKEWNNDYFSKSGAKFWLSNESKILDLPNNLEHQNPITVYRIEALQDFNDVKVGDLGGWVQSEANLSQEGMSWIYGEACVVEDALVKDNAVVLGNALAVYQAVIKDSAIVTGNAFVAGSSIIADNACVSNSACVLQEAKIMGNAEVKDFAFVGGYAVLKDDAVVAENDEFYDGILNNALSDYYNAETDEEIDLAY